MGDGSNQHDVRLPDDAPQGLREFVACRRMSVVVDVTDSSWLPAPPGLPDGSEPDVELEPGPTATSGTVSIGWGFVRMSLPVHIEDGRLVVEAGDLPFGIGPEIDRWTDRLNATLAANDKALDGFQVDGDRLTITKREVAAAPRPAATGPVTPATTPDGAGARDDDPDTQPDDGSKRSGCGAWILGGIVALAAAAGITWAATSGDDGGSASDPAPAPTPTADIDVAATAPSTIAAEAREPVATPTSDVTVAPTEPADDPAVCETVQVGEFPVGAYPELPAPCDPDGLVGYDDCVPGPILCSHRQAPPMLLPGRPGVSHRGSRPDAVTGQQGPSEAQHPIWIGPVTAVGDGWQIEVRADCAGSEVTGRAPVIPGDVTEVPHPLFQYGTCRAQGGTLFGSDGVPIIELPGAVFADGGTYDIGPAETPPTPEPIEGLTLVDDRFRARFEQGWPSFDEWDWSDDAVTVRNVLAAAPLPDECFWFVSPGDADLLVEALDGCATDGHYWVFYGALADVEFELTAADTVTGHAATYTNPLGTEGGWTEGFDTAEPLFDDTIFPCGVGHVGVTVCPENAGPVGAGGFVTVAIATGGPLPLEPDGIDRAHVIDFGPAGGGRYRVAQGEDGGWTLSGPDATRARAVHRGRSLTLVVPDTELPATGAVRYVVRSEIDGQVVEQPEVPVLGLATTPEVVPAPSDTDGSDTAVTAADPSTVTEQAVRAFYAQLSESLASGDLEFPLARLHPVVGDAYPDRCPAALESFVDPEFGIELVELVGPEPWTWTLPDGREYPVPDALTTVVRLSGRGQPGEPTETHLATVDGELHWFTFCP